MDVVTSARDAGQSAIVAIRDGWRAAGRAAGVLRAWRRCDAALQVVAWEIKISSSLLPRDLVVLYHCYND